MCASCSCSGGVVEHRCCNGIANLDVMLMSLSPPGMSDYYLMYISSVLVVNVA